MDINPSRKESSQHLITLGDDFAQIFKPKSFRCSFCKRGFSNAQALGGHMNIHRKDRAKLREFSDQNFLSLEISRSGDSNDILPPDSRSHDEDDQAEENLNNYVRGILLFAEAAPAVSGGVESKKVELKYGEVDLELRLGPEPHHHAKSKP